MCPLIREKIIIEYSFTQTVRTHFVQLCCKKNMGLYFSFKGSYKHVFSFYRHIQA